MRHSRLLSITSLFAMLLLCGCNAGDAPTPMSSEDVRSAVDKAKPEDQIAFWKSSPLTQAEKDAKIAAIRQKYNLPTGPGLTTNPGLTSGNAH